jgi:hypothetical protein
VEKGRNAMSILKDIYNWLAQRNIGAMLGLKWDPQKDERYQRERQARNAMMMAYPWLTRHLPQAEQELGNGNVQEAQRLAYRALEVIPDSDVPIAQEARAKARSIIARLPTNMEPPPPTPKIPAHNVVAEAQRILKLIDEGKVEEADRLLAEVSGKDITDGGDSKLGLAAHMAILSCVQRIKEVRGEEQ